jgi:antitoxin MazE
VQILRWNNSLAVRFPATVVDALEMEEGDEIHIQVTGPSTFTFMRKAVHQERLALGYKSPVDDTQALIPA